MKGQPKIRAAALSELCSLESPPTRTDSSGNIADAEPLPKGRRLLRVELQQFQATWSAGVWETARIERRAAQIRDLPGSTSATAGKDPSDEVDKPAGGAQKLG